MQVRAARLSDLDDLARMAVELWPRTTFEEERRSMEAALSGRSSYAFPHLYMIACTDSGSAIGFAEVTLRSIADGCDPIRPAGYLEGWYVDAEHRRMGVGKALVAAAEAWARAQGCTEFASDVLIDNLGSQLAHETLGFEVVDRCVHYRKLL